jgi:hypothetical protein
MKNLLIIALITFSITACTPDDPANTGTSSPFTLKYEYVLTSPALNGPLNSQTFIYTNATGQVETGPRINDGDMSWSKTITVTTSTRPLIVQLGQTTMQIRSAGSVTANIYINGVLKASSNNPSINNNGFFYSIVPTLVYTVN